MNRRGFFGLLGKLVQVGAAMSILPVPVKPVQEVIIPKEVPTVTWVSCSPGCPMCEGVTAGPTFTLAS